MKDTRALKEVIGKVEEQYCFCVVYITDDGLYGMYIWAKNAYSAGEEFKKRVPGKKIKEIKLSWPR